MKILEALQGIKKKALIKKNTPPDVTALSTPVVYESDDKSLQLQICRCTATTKSGKSFLYRLINMRSNNSYYFCFSQKMTEAERKELFDKIVPIVKQNRDDIRNGIIGETARTLEKENDLLKEILDTTQQLSQLMQRYSGSFFTQKEEQELAAKMTVALHDIADSFLSAKASTDTGNKFVIESVAMPDTDKITTGAVLGKIYEVKKKEGDKEIQDPELLVALIRESVRNIDEKKYEQKLSCMMNCINYAVTLYRIIYNVKL